MKHSDNPLPNEQWWSRKNNVFIEGYQYMSFCSVCNEEGNCPYNKITDSEKDELIFIYDKLEKIQEKICGE